MTESWMPLVGALAAVLSSLSYIAQVLKAWPRGETGDLSVRMLVALTAGLALWIVYGWLRGDWTIMAANIVGASLSSMVLALKIRDIRAGD